MCCSGGAPRSCISRIFSFKKKKKKSIRKIRTSYSSRFSFWKKWILALLLFPEMSSESQNLKRDPGVPKLHVSQLLLHFLHLLKLIKFAETNHLAPNHLRARCFTWDPGATRSGPWDDWCEIDRIIAWQSFSGYSVIWYDSGGP